MPQMGHAPGLSETTSGCMGQVQEFRGSEVAGSEVAGSEVRDGGRRSVSGAAVDFIGRGPRASQPSGSSANCVRHPELQKKYVVPPCSNDPPRAVAGSTRMPQTG